MVFKRGEKVLLLGDVDVFSTVGTQISTHLGILETKKLIGKKPGSKIKTHKGHTYVAIKPTVVDSLYKLKRGPQVILPKDAATILSVTGVNRNSIVFDVGSGSGWLSIFLANYVKEVYTFEQEPKFHKLAKQNIETSGLKNITIRKKDVVERGFAKKGADLITIDLKDHFKVIPHAARSLNVGGWVFCHCPVIEQVQRTCKELERQGFGSITIIENTQSQWKANPTRPVKSDTGHTAFSVFGRKL